MDALIHLWLPIVVAAIFVFVASSLIHMVFKWHNSDYRKLANEDDVMAALRAGSAAPGQYVVPHCADMKQMQNEAMQAKYRQGPVGFVTLIKSGPPNIGPSLIKWFVFNLAVASVAGAITLHTLGATAHAPSAGHLAGLLSLLAYAGGSVQQGIWMGRPWVSVSKDLLDALIYATVSALAFWWLWP